jgi:hypothetical protein
MVRDPPDVLTGPDGSIRVIGRAWNHAGAGPGDGPLVIDIDSFIGEVHSEKKQGAGYGYSRTLALEPQTSGPWSAGGCSSPIPSRCASVAVTSSPASLTNRRSSNATRTESSVLGPLATSAASCTI